MIKAGIIGATGYAGGELVRILKNHKDVEIVWYGSKSYIDKRYSQVYQNLFQIVEDVCRDDNLSLLAGQVDVIFTATPQGFLAGILTEEILSKVKIVDLSADYRIKDVAVYEKWYGIEHKSPQFIKEAVLWALRAEPQSDYGRYKAGGESRLLHHLLHSHGVSAGEGGAD